MYSDAQKMFLLCKRDVQPVGTDRIYLLQGKKKKKKKEKKGSDRICLWQNLPDPPEVKSVAYLPTRVKLIPVFM